MVHTDLGKSLSELHSGQLSLHSILLLVYELIGIIESLHVQQVLMRVLWPGLVTVNGNSSTDRVSLNQFTYMKFLVDSLSGEHIKPRQKKTLFCGEEALKYLSVNALNCWETSRRDDIETLGYLALFLLEPTTFSGIEQNITFKQNINQYFEKKSIPSFFIRNYSHTDFLRQINVI